MDVQLTAPLTRDSLRDLHAGDRVFLSGVIYSARDAAHKRLCELVRAGRPLPFPIAGAVIYYMGPSPARPGRPIGAAGPTSSYRMDAYAPMLLDLGQLGMIGKGRRDASVIDAICRNGAVYFGAVGGAGALLSACIKKAELVAYEDLGAEAVRRLEVENFPLTVVIDSRGNNLYELGPKAYLKTQTK